ncbi:MAG TPA: ABC transporter ATP-binding protein, partial [Gemmatimonadaceae bacterium]|nr:ABC transporter ATP-binding protein [Gemmatimonadaceae bacterium]
AEVLGIDARAGAAAVRARCGALHEHDGLYERLSAEENLDYYGRIWRLPGPDRARRVRELLGHVGLWDRRADRVGTWSRGMKQKLAIARAVMHRPPLVFLDEPTAGLDPVASASLRDDLVRLAQQEGVTIFLTTHNLAEAERLCALVGVIRKGKLLDFGAPQALRASRGSPVVHVVGAGLDDPVVEALAASAAVAGVARRGDGIAVHLAPGGDVPSIVAWLVQRGVRLEEVRRDRASFEDVFLELVTGDAPTDGANGAAPMGEANGAAANRPVEAR